MNNGYFYTYNVIFNAPVSAAAKLVYAYLSKRADKDGKCFPSQGDVGARTSLSITSVKQALAELKAAELISVRGEARQDGGRRANTYTINKDCVNSLSMDCADNANNSGGFFLAYGDAFMPGLTAKARLAYLYLCRLASGSDVAYPSHNTTATACGLSKAGVRLALDELELAGLVRRQAQYREDGGQRANLYTIAVGDGERDSSDERNSREDTHIAPNNSERCGDGDNRYTCNDNNNVGTVDAPSQVHGNAVAPSDVTDAAAIAIAYSSSNAPSLISSKSSNSESFMPNPCATRCSVRREGFFVLPFTILSKVDCVTPDSVASLFSVISRSWHKRVIRFVIASAYVTRPPPLPSYG